MEYFLTVIFFVFGTIVGSFLNVVILRYNSGFGLSGRSLCLSCGARIPWYGLFPLISFFTLRGKCAHCASRISWQYPIVESLTGFIFSISFLRFFLDSVLDFHTLFLFTTALVIWSVLIVIAFYDFAHKIIPNFFVYVFIFLALIYQVFFSFFFPEHFLLDLSIGPILFGVFYLLWLFSRGKYLGFGDAKLVLGIGFFLGASGAVSAVILAFWIGAVVSLFLLALSKMNASFKHSYELFSKLKKLTIKSEIPFAPFLILGTFIVFFFGLRIIDIQSLFLP